MKKSYLMGLALVAVCAFSATAATSAFALESVFLVNAVRAAAAAKSASVGEVELNENLNKPAIKCKVKQATNSGTVGTGGVAKADEVTAIALEECKSSVCSSVTVSLDGLPWKTELTLEGTTFLDLILKSGTEVPGWKVDCVILGILIEVLCEALLATGGAEDYATTLTNNEGGFLNTTFSESEKGKCTNGGEGWVKGTVETLSTEGKTIAVSEG